MPKPEATIGSRFCTRAERLLDVEGVEGAEDIHTAAALTTTVFNVQCVVVGGDGERKRHFSTG